MFRDKLKNLLSKNNRYENSEKCENGESLKEIENKENIGNDKKKIENLVFFVILLIITIVIINYIWNGSEKANKNEITNDTSKQLAQSTSGNSDGVSNIENSLNTVGASSSNTSVSDLENKLKNILAKIQGVGDVEVCLNYSESSEVVAMYNENSTTSTTEETDDTGGTRKIEEIDTQKDVIYKEEDGIKTPITAKVVGPKIEGAIITAKGANNSETKSNIIQAVEAITGLATHKIQVFEMQ